MNNATISSFGIYQNFALSSLLIVEYVKTYQEENKKEVEFERLFVVLPFCYTEFL
ncbi:three component ABC system middle component [Sphingobacterium sp.]|uniref:three component ABC system middle component n=1 Tax=Sphingobacterium sp. TaxID=341027 RepID=UPI002898737B|nr:three component ABC system middle component [Sphingobacterium sp.]